MTILASVAATGLLAGCSTFDTDTVARVDGTELNQVQLDELVTILPSSDQAQPPGTTGSLENPNDIRQAISVWIQATVQQDVLDERAIVISDLALDDVTANLSAQLPGFSGLSDDSRDLLIGYLAGGEPLASVPAETSPELIAFYNQGTEDSGIICVSHILVENEAAADDIVARLGKGADFAELAAAESTDPGSGAAGGDLGCTFVNDFVTQFVPEFVAGALPAEIGEPTAPIMSDFGFHVILVRDGESSAAGLAPIQSNLRYLARIADITVDSRYGSFDTTVGAVLPLG
ncbi:MAG: hypothetical protein ACJAXA_002952 [Candidatus Aldehydirespiratoraceae bacterium]|jgi:hypothetical protein